MNSIVFVGSSGFSLPFLDYFLYSSNIEVKMVVTRPEKKCGRYHKIIRKNEVHTYALQNNIPIIFVDNHQDTKGWNLLINFLNKNSVDGVFMTGFGVKIPNELLNMAKFGWTNLHPSLLPRWRGAAPIERALLDGDDITGVTFLEVTEKYDEGRYYAQIETPISENETLESLRNNLIKIAIDYMEIFIEKWINLKFLSSKYNYISKYAKKLNIDDFKINWNDSIDKINLIINGLKDKGIAWFLFDGKRILVHNATIYNRESTGEPGEIVSVEDDCLLVNVLDGVIAIDRLQLENRCINDWKVLKNSHFSKKLQVGVNLS